MSKFQLKATAGVVLQEGTTFAVKMALTTGFLCQIFRDFKDFPKLFLKNLLYLKKRLN